MKTSCNLIPRLGISMAFALFMLTQAMAEERPLILTLVSEHTAISPGQPFTLGLYLQHQEHHHSYWKEPGIVGVPTSLEWDLPAGFTAGTIQWPIPVIVDMRGHGAYGYKEDTLLVIDLSAPTHLEPGDRVTLKAKAGYMCCSQERCTPGFQDLSLTLPVQHAGHEGVSDDQWVAAFEKARASFPQPAADWQGRARFDQRKKHYEVSLEAPAGVTLPKGKDLYWFSTSGLINSEKPQIIRCEGNVVSMALPRHPFADAEADAFAGILRSETGWPMGDRRVAGLSIVVPMADAAPPDAVQRVIAPAPKPNG